VHSAVRSTLQWLGDPQRATRAIAGPVVALFLGQLLATVVLATPQELGQAAVLAGLLIHALFAGVVVAGAIRTARGPLAPERYPRLLWWHLSGVVVALAINLVLAVIFPADSVAEGIGWITFAGTLGATAGFVVGRTEAKAVERAVSAEREVARTEALAAQRDRFEYMNALLRHEVLNNVQVIQGNAEFLLETVDGDEELRRRLAIIGRQSEDMAQVVEEVRLVSDGLENTDLRPVDLCAVLRGELRDLEDGHESIETELDCPDGVHVVADELVARVFSNLFSNAVEHNDADRPQISVDVDVGDAVTVRVADNGPGISERVRDTLFDRSAGPHGVGLYLVDTLVNHYGGRVELAETGAQGTVFTVELRHAAGEGAQGQTGTGPDQPAASERTPGEHSALDTDQSVVGDDED
jgi:signal transduction histidine kinase